MALDSIAKLSVLITGDETPLAASANRAEQIVADVARRIEDPWKRGLAAMAAQNDKWAAGLARLAEQNAPGGGGLFDNLSLGARQYSDAVAQAHQRTLQLSTVMSAMRGNIPAIFRVAGAAGRTGGPALAIAGITVVAYKLAAAADALHQKLGAAEIDTWAGQWKRSKDELSETAGIVGGPLAIAFREVTQGVADLQQRFNEWIKPDRIRQMEQHLANVARLEEDAVNSARHALMVKEAQARAAKLSHDLLAAEERRRDENTDFQRLNFGRADAIRDMVRTPAEELRRFSIELRSLFTSGFIDEETINRALEMAEQKARDAVNGRQVAAARAAAPNAAVERFTSAGFNAMREAQSNQRTQQEHKQIAQQQLQVQQAELGVMQHIQQTLLEFPTTAPFMLSRLN